MSRGVGYLRSLQIFPISFQDTLIVENELSNAIERVSYKESRPWKFQFYFNEIKELSSQMHVVFLHEVRLANRMVDALAKQGVDRVILWVISNELVWWVGV